VKHRNEAFLNNNLLHKYKNRLNLRQSEPNQQNEPQA